MNWKGTLIHLRLYPAKDPLRHIGQADRYKMSVRMMFFMIGAGLFFWALARLGLLSR